MGASAVFADKKVRTQTTQLTARQEQIIHFAWAFYKANDSLPPHNVIAEAMGFKSTNAAYEQLLSLERKGYLARNAVKKFKFTDRSRDLFAPVSA